MGCPGAGGGHPHWEQPVLLLLELGHESCGPEGGSSTASPMEGLPEGDVHAQTGRMGRSDSGEVGGVVGRSCAKAQRPYFLGKE